MRINNRIFHKNSRCQAPVSARACASARICQSRHMRGAFEPPLTTFSSEISHVHVMQPVRCFEELAAVSELIDYLTDIITKLVSSCMLAQTHLEVALFFCYAFSKKVFFCYVHKLYSLWQIGSTSRLHPFHSLSLSRSAYLFPSLISSCVRDEKRSRPRQAPSRLCTAFVMRTISPFSSYYARYPHPWGWQVTSAPKPINWNNPQLPRGASKVPLSWGWGGWG